MLQHWFSK